MSFIVHLPQGFVFFPVSSTSINILPNFNIGLFGFREVYSVVTKGLYQRNFLIYWSAFEIRFEWPKD